MSSLFAIIFMLNDIVFTLMDTSNPSKGLVTTIRLFSSTSGTQMPNSVLGAARLVC
jgi:hypothetical protein